MTAFAVTSNAMHVLSLPRLTVCFGTCLVFCSVGCSEQSSAPEQGDGLAGSPSAAAGGTTSSGGGAATGGSDTGGTEGSTPGSPTDCNDGTGSYIDHAAIFVDDSGVFVASAEALDLGGV